GSTITLLHARQCPQKSLLGEFLGFFSVMPEIESDPKCFLHILPHENLENFTLSLLTERHDLLIPKVLLSSLVHLKSFDTEPASGWGFEVSRQLFRRSRSGKVNGCGPEENFSRICGKTVS